MKGDCRNGSFGNGLTRGSESKSGVEVDSFAAVPVKSLCRRALDGCCKHGARR